MTAYQKRIVKYYNKRVYCKTFREEDLVLRQITQNSKIPSKGALGANWEGPYKVTNVVRPGVYKLQYSDGREVKKPWNVEMLKKYYP